MNNAIRTNCQRLYGCVYDAAVAANQGLPLRALNSMAAAYDRQRHHAGRRGIGWEISFPEWAVLWQTSGRWPMRGRTRDSYCMARNGDEGPYRVGNVAIQQVSVNCKDASTKAQKTSDFSAYATRRRGTGRGWTFVAKSRLHPYQVCIGDRYVGSFATQSEAEAAYAAAV